MLLQAKLSSKCFMLLFYLIFSILRNMYSIPILQITEHKEVQQVAQGHGKVAIQDLNVRACSQASALPTHQAPCPSSSVAHALFPQEISTTDPAKSRTLPTSQPTLPNYPLKPHRKETRSGRENSGVKWAASSSSLSFMDVSSFPA